MYIVRHHFENLDLDVKVTLKNERLVFREQHTVTFHFSLFTVTLIPRSGFSQWLRTMYMVDKL